MEVEAFVRFRDANDSELYGSISRSRLNQNKSLEGLTVNLLSGDPFTGFAVTEDTAVVVKLLCPLRLTPAIYGIGINYQKHAEEAGLKVPKHPLVFTKPPDALAGPYEDIPIHPECHSHLDYEGELVVVIGRDCLNAERATALSYVLGYTAGNDVSARNFQKAENSGGQHGYAKSFDKFAPIGPAIVLSTAIKNPSEVLFTTMVNSEERQKTSTGDMMWSVEDLIVHLSRGRTLRKGTIIMTGTPTGVGSHKDPPLFLNDGDIVEVHMDNIGVLRNKMKF